MCLSGSSVLYLASGSAMIRSVGSAALFATLERCRTTPPEPQPFHVCYVLIVTCTRLLDKVGQGEDVPLSVLLHASTCVLSVLCLLWCFCD